jgi:hypothetical protein
MTNHTNNTISKTTQAASRRERLSEIFLFLILLISYSYIFPRWADPNQNSRLDMIVAVVDDGTLQIDKYVQNTVDYAKVGVHYYSDKAPGVAFAGIPIYAGLKVILNTPITRTLLDKLKNNSSFQATLNPEGTGIFEEKLRFALALIVISFFLSILPSALIGILLFRLAGFFGVDIKWRFLGVLCFGFLTPIFAYSNSLYGYSLNSLLLLGSFYFLAKNERFSIPGLFAIGLAMGYGVMTEYPTFLIAAVIGVYGLIRLYQSKQLIRVIWILLGGLLVAVGLGLYNNAVFGGPFNLGYGYSELWERYHQTGFMGLSVPTFTAAWGITFSLYRGLFILSPLLLLAIPGYWLWLESASWRKEGLAVLIIVIFMLFFNSSSVMWWGGFSIGPRYLYPMLPFFFLALFFVFEKWRQSLVFQIIFGILCLISFIATWGLSLAGQSFPPDTIPNPWLGYALPNWLSGNIARNFGTILHLNGYLSLLPLLALIAILVTGWSIWVKKQTR